MRDTNHLAVIAAVVLHQVLGFVWYGLLFLEPYARGLGKEAVDLQQPRPIPIALDVIGWIVAAYVMAWLVRATRTDSAIAGALLGAVLWLGVAVPTLVPHYAFAEIAPTVTTIDAANALAGYVITGAVIAGWPRKRMSR